MNHVTRMTEKRMTKKAAVFNTVLLVEGPRPIARDGPITVGRVIKDHSWSISPYKIPTKRFFIVSESQDVVTPSRAVAIATFRS